MAEQTEPQLRLAEMIVDVLSLENRAATDIDPDAQLFDEGLGLDSIDALEIAVAIASGTAQVMADLSVAIGHGSPLACHR